MTLDIQNKKLSYDLNIILNKLLENETYSDIAKKINVASGTVKRWTEMGVPKSYTFELLKMSKTEIDYSKFTFSEKDQFFTPKHTAEYCYSKFLDVLKEYKENYKNYIFIEPSAGDGSFLNVLPKDRRIGLDIEPRSSEVIKHD